MRSVLARAGCNSLTVATVYHTARDLLPHGQKGRLAYLEGGVTYFRPELSRYPGLLQPKPSALCDETDPLGDVVTAAADCDTAVTAWVVYLHNTRLGKAVPETTIMNVFGDRILSILCPANPQVGRYVESLTADIVSRGVSAIAAESLHFHPLEHGYHHERYFIDLSDLAKFLMALCFCDHCRLGAKAAGIDAGAAAAQVRSVLDTEFAVGGGDLEPFDLAMVESRCGPSTAEYVANRDVTVESLVRRTASITTAGGVDLEVIDPAGSLDEDLEVGFLHTAAMPTRLQESVSTNAVLAYGSSGTNILGRYATQVNVDQIRAVMRPMFPDCSSSDDLVQRVRDARQFGIRRFGFYHYDLMRLQALDWINDALEAEHSGCRQ